MPRTHLTEAMAEAMDREQFRLGTAAQRRDLERNCIFEAISIVIVLRGVDESPWKTL